MKLDLVFKDVRPAEALADRIESKFDKIEKILMMADRANIISRIAGTDTYMPRPKHLHGVE